jgi:hypothetical protein
MSSVKESIADLIELISSPWTENSSVFSTSLDRVISEIAREIFNHPFCDKPLENPHLLVLKKKDVSNYESVQAILYASLNQPNIPQSLKKRILCPLVKTWSDIKNNFRVVFGDGTPSVVLTEKKHPFYNGNFFSLSNKINLQQTLQSLCIPSIFARDLLLFFFSKSPNVLNNDYIFLVKYDDVFLHDLMNRCNEAVEIYLCTLRFIDYFFPDLVPNLPMRFFNFADLPSDALWELHDRLLSTGPALCQSLTTALNFVKVHLRSRSLNESMMAHEPCSLLRVYPIERPEAIDTLDADTYSFYLLSENLKTPESLNYFSRLLLNKKVNDIPAYFHALLAGKIATFLILHAGEEVEKVALVQFIQMIIKKIFLDTLLGNFYFMLMLQYVIVNVHGEPPRTRTQDILQTWMILLIYKTKSSAKLYKNYPPKRFFNPYG